MIRAPKEDSNTATSGNIWGALIISVLENRASLMFHNLSTPLGSAVKMWLQVKINLVRIMNNCYLKMS